MIATFIIEIFLAAYVTWRYSLNNITKLAASILFFLAVFQLAEYNVCEGAFGIDSLGWSRLGYASITMLPPLGLHLASRIAGRKNTMLLTAAYTSAAAFVAFFAFTGHGIVSSACTGNYVIFNTAPGSSVWYGIYYWGWLAIGSGYAWRAAQKQSLPNKSAALKALAIGYLVFMVPTITVNMLDPATTSAIPSIMCGFAVMLAIILAGEVLPQYYRRPSLTQQLSGTGVEKIRGKTIK
jgi:hypothetical protein